MSPPSTPLGSGLRGEMANEEDCWCYQYHTYKFGTRTLVYCEHGCHSEKTRVTLEYVAPNTENERLRVARSNLARRGFVFPTDASYLRTEVYVDEFPERWYENYE